MSFILRFLSPLHHFPSILLSRASFVKTDRINAPLLVLVAIGFFWMDSGQALAKTGSPSSVIDSRALFRILTMEIKISSLQSSGKIDKKKLRESLLGKTPMMVRCYRMVLTRAFKDLKKNKKPATVKKWKGFFKNERITFRIKLNRHGRALRTTPLKNALPISLRDCFSWYLRGRRFFPPVGNKSISFQVGFQVLLHKKKRKTSPK